MLNHALHSEPGWCLEGSWKVPGRLLEVPASPAGVASLRRRYGEIWRDVGEIARSAIRRSKTYEVAPTVQSRE